MRKFVMGDIHGSYKALIQCLERSEFDKENDILIQLGDISDGWSQTYECVEELMTIKNLIPIQGNHDFWTLKWMSYGFMQYEHKSQGGAATMYSYSERSPEDRERHLKFFKSQILYYIDEKNRCFIHGGFNKDYKLDNDIDLHNHSWNRTLWKQAMSCQPEHRLNDVNDFNEIFIGHTTTINWDIDKPMNKAQVWNLDTGAGFNGRLTIMDVDSKEYWQSDLVQELYINEKGRN
jgi:serine/threonine protein phosphatase 1